MKAANLVSAVAVATVLGASTVQAQGGYQYQDVDYPGAEGTQLFGINNRGDAVGNGSVGGVPFPFVYSVKKQQFTNIAPVTGYSATVLLGISDSGILVGSVDSEDFLTTDGLIIGKNSETTVFSHPEAFSFTQARGVNNKGIVTGFRDSDDPDVIPGFIYDSNTGEFTDVAPSLFSIAQGINNKGEVVGSATYFPDDSPCPSAQQGTVRLAWLRKPDGTLNYFEVNGGRTSARGITDSGTVTGFVGSQSFVTTLDGTQCQAITIAEADLLTAPNGPDFTGASDISNSGVIAGNASDEFGSSGFIATPVAPKKSK